MIWVTGSTGFIGREVLRQLVEQGSVQLTPQCDAVIHLAGETHDPLLMYISNIQATQRTLLEAHHARLRRLVFISSVAVTDLEQGFTATSYAWSKWGAEQLVRQSTLQTIIIRLPTVYSTGRKNWYIMACKSLLCGQNPWRMISLEEAVTRILKEIL